jgi:hypothetical protein
MDVPEIQVERITRDGSEQLRFYCQHCRQYHYHAAGDRPGDGDGHRVAHCHDHRSPFSESGYTLREIDGKWQPNELAGFPADTGAMRDSRTYAPINGSGQNFDRSNREGWLA